jgi:hypothetical protein
MNDHSNQSSDASTAWVAQPEDVALKSRLLGTVLLQVGSGLLGLTALGYVLGVWRWYWYLSAFRATWLLSYVPARSLLTAAAFPALGVSLCTTIFLVLRVSPTTPARLWKRVGQLGFFVPLSYTATVFVESLWPAGLPFISYVLLMAVGAGDSAAYVAAILAVKDAPVHRVYRSVCFNVIFVLFGMFYILLLTGDCAGRADRNLGTTTLPRLTWLQGVRGSALPEYVLVSTDALIFTIPLPLPKGSTRVPVRAYPLQNVREVLVQE